MQGPPGAQGQEELEGTGDAVQIAQRLEVWASGYCRQVPVALALRGQ